MARKILVIIVIIGLMIAAVFLWLFLPTPASQDSQQLEVLAENLEVPWAIAFLPNGTMIFTQRGGEVSILEDKNVKNVGNISVTQNGESGLMGIAVNPQFNQNSYIYLYYTMGNYNRISRFKLGTELENETVLLDKIPAAQIHNGGRLKFGQDGKLYATTGDSGNSGLAQDLNSLGGKILRLNPDGTVPGDNPYGSYIYTYGNRDPQGIAWGPDGTIYESEHGDVRNDEINIITRGGNYGWPLYQGNDTAPGFIKPLRAYTEQTLAPSGLTYYKNALYLACLRGSQLRRVTLSTDGQRVIGEKAFFTELGRIREVVEHDGYLYISTSNRDGRGKPKAGDDKIIRVKMGVELIKL